MDSGPEATRQVHAWRELQATGDERLAATPPGQLHDRQRHQWLVLEERLQGRSITTARRVLPRDVHQGGMGGHMSRVADPFEGRHELQAAAALQRTCSCRVI